MVVAAKAKISSCFKLEDLPFGEFDDGGGDLTDDGEVPIFGENSHGPGKEDVSGEDAGGVSEDGGSSGLPSSCGRVIDDIVMDEGCHVDHLHTRAELAGPFGIEWQTGGTSSQDDKGGAKAFSAGVEGVPTDLVHELNAGGDTLSELFLNSTDLSRNFGQDFLADLFNDGGGSNHGLVPQWMQMLPMKRSR